jgi:hypothetical protein
MKNFGTTPTLSATAGALAAILTHPFDTVKSIRQVRFNNQPQSTTGTLYLLRQMLREQGVRSWYKGTLKKIEFIILD